MAERPASATAIGVVGPIELAEYRDYLYPDALAGSFPRGLGGAPVNLLCKELLDRGHRLVVFSLDRSIKDERIFAGKRLKIYLGPYTNNARNLFSQERKFLLHAIRQENVSMLHAHFTYEFALAAIESGLPHVVTAHDAPINCLRYKFAMPDPRTIGSYYRTTRAVIYWTLRTLMAYKAARAAQRVVAVCPYVAEHLRRYRLRAEPAEIVPNGVPAAYFERTPRTGQGTVTFATVLSGWAGLKNGGVAIEAFTRVRRALPDARMLMLGDGHSADGPAAGWARERGWDDGIEFLGLVPHADVIDLLSRHVDVLVHPSLEEAHPMPLIEAMSLSIPAIGGSGVGGVPWTLGEGEYGVLVDVRSAEQLASAMLRLAQDEQGRVELGIAGRRSVKSRFHIAQVADRYEAIYAELASQAPMRPAPALPRRLKGA